MKHLSSLRCGKSGPTHLESRLSTVPRVLHRSRLEKSAMTTIKSLAFALGIFLTGCAIITSEPLSDPLTAQPNPSLYGHWVGTLQNREEIHLFVSPRKSKESTSSENHKARDPDSIMEWAMIRWSPAKNTLDSTASGYFTVTRIGPSTYLNILTCNDLLAAPQNQRNDEWYYERWVQTPTRCVSVLAYTVGESRLTLKSISSPE